MVKNRYIKVKFQKEGVHKFPGADKDPKYATGNWDDVSFLGYPHRHVFHFYVTLGVTHNDRDVEFIQFKRELERLYTKNVLHLDYQSCEMIAEDLINYIEHIIFIGCGTSFNASSTDNVFISCKAFSTSS